MSIVKYALEHNLIDDLGLNRNFFDAFAFSMELDKEEDEFCIDLEDAQKWIGIPRKDHAKKFLILNFEEDFDYKISLPKNGERGGSSHREKIMLTVSCFKDFGMQAKTIQGKSIRKYFIIMEKIAKKFIEYQIDEKNKLIEEKDKENDKLVRKLEKLRYKPTGTIYIRPTDHNRASFQGIDLYKLGKTVNMKTRESTYNTGSVNTLSNLYEKTCVDPVLVEHILKKLLRGHQHVAQREIYEIDLILLKKLIINVAEFIERKYEILRKDIFGEDYDSADFDSSEDLEDYKELHIFKKDDYVGYALNPCYRR